MDISAACQRANALVQEYAQDPSPELALEVAYSLDRVGREQAAIGYYELAFEGTMPDEERCGAYFCYVSSLRNVHRYEQARTFIDKAIREYPNEPLLEIMRALVLYDTGQAHTAVQMLGATVLREVENTRFYGLKVAAQKKLRGWSYRTHPQ